MTVRRFALLGHPIGHTMSPFIHEKLFALSGCPGKYGTLDAPPGRVTRLVKNVLNVFHGYNVTIPYKRKIIPMLGSLDEKAARYGSVNTVLCREGETKGFTTDSDGLLAALRTAKIPLAGRVVVLGSGGTARIMAYEAAQAGCEVRLAVRESRLKKAEALALEIRTACSEAPVSVCGMDAIEGEFELLMNATPVGMYPKIQDLPVEASVLSKVRYLFDAIYNPGETKLMQAARAAGAQVSGGMPMLVWQAAAAHTIWDGVEFDPGEIEALCEEASAEMRRRFADE